MRAYILLTLTIILQPVSAISSQLEQVTLQGIDRQYRVHNSEAANEGAAPLVLHLHGYRNRHEAEAGRETLDYIAWKKLEETAEVNGFILAQPAAYWGQWSLFSGLKNIKLENGLQIDDMQFISEVVDKLVNAGLADKNRVYLSGISDGAIMSYRLLCEPDSPFAAAVTIVGTMSEKQISNCATRTPTPIMVIAGTNDRILPYDGGLFPEGRDASIPEIMEYWRLKHGCKEQKFEFLKDLDLEDNSRVQSITWTKCDRDDTVKLLRVEGAGHAVPSFAPVSDAWSQRGGGHNRDIESAEEVWEFVKKFRFTK